MRNIILILFVYLVSCTNASNSKQSEASSSSSNENNETSQPAQPASTNTSEPQSIRHNDVEIEEEGDTEIEDDVTDEAEPYEPDVNLSKTSQDRMNELISDSKYIRNSGKLKRAKIARQLNRDGYRKSDGSKFRRRDIPKE